MGEPGDNINTDIGNLVKKGPDTRIQQALDIMRVIGNETVHSGQIDLRDDRATATELFRLVNIIADTMVSQPKRIEEMYKSLPAEKLKGIVNRDKKRPEDEARGIAQAGFPAIFAVSLTIERLSKLFQVSFLARSKARKCVYL